MNLLRRLGSQTKIFYYLPSSLIRSTHNKFRVDRGLRPINSERSKFLLLAVSKFLGTDSSLIRVFSKILRLAHLITILWCLDISFYRGSLIVSLGLSSSYFIITWKAIDRFFDNLGEVSLLSSRFIIIFLWAIWRVGLHDRQSC